MYEALKNANESHLHVYLKEDIPEELHYRNHRRIQPIFLMTDLGWVMKKVFTWEIVSESMTHFMFVSQLTLSTQSMFTCAGTGAPGISRANRIVAVIFTHPYVRTGPCLPFTRP